MSPSVTNPAKKPTLLTPDLAVENAETSAEKPTESSVVKQKIGNVENTENTENTGSEEHESQKSQENENDKNDDKNEDDKKNNLNCSLLWKYVPIAYMYPCCCVDTVSIWILRFGWVYFCIGFYILYWRDNSGLPPWSMFPLVEVSMLGFAVPGFVLIHGLNLVKKDRARVLGEERQARLDAERAKRGYLIGIVFKVNYYFISYLSPIYSGILVFHL